MTALTDACTTLSNEEISETLDLYIPSAVAIESASFDEETACLSATLSTARYSIIRDGVNGINYLTASQIHTHLAQVGYIFANQYRIRSLAPMRDIAHREFKNLIYNGSFKFSGTSVSYHAPVYNDFRSYTMQISLERAVSAKDFRFAKIRFETNGNYFSGSATISIGPV